MRAALDDATLVEDDDAVGGADGGQAVGDDEGGAPLHHGLERALEAGLRVRVDARRGLVEDEERRVAVERAREGDELTLAGAEVLPALVDAGVEAPRAPLEDLQRADARERLLDPRRDRASRRPWRRSRRWCRRTARRPAGRRRSFAAARAGRSSRTSLPSTRHRPRPDLVEAEEEARDGGLARAGGADQRELLPALAPQRLTSRSTGAPSLYSKADVRRARWSSSTAPGTHVGAAAAGRPASFSSRSWKTRSAPAIALCRRV